MSIKNKNIPSGAIHVLLLMNVSIQAVVAPVNAGENLWQIVRRIGLTIDQIESKVDSITTVHGSTLDALFPCNVCSSLDEISRDVNAITSSFEELQSSLIEEFDQTQSILSQLDLDGPTIDDNSTTSIFGDSIVGLRNDQVDIKFNYSVAPYDITTATTGSGTITTSSNMALLQTGVATTALSDIRSKKKIQYRAGHASYALFTAVFGTPAVGSLAFIGPFDGFNGFGVGFIDTTFSLFSMKGGVQTFVSQGSFNRDTLDGTGPSSMIFDPLALNLFRINYGWLGASIVEFQIMNTTGDWVTFHVIEYPNTQATPLIDNPVVPLHALVQKTSGAANITLATSAWAGGIISDNSHGAGHRYFSRTFSSTLTLSVGSSVNHVATIHNKTTYQGATNAIPVRISYCGGGNISTMAGTVTSISLRFIKNGTVTGTTFADVDTASSVMEVSTAGTYTAATGAEQLGMTGTNSFTFIPDSYEILLQPGETLTILAENVLGLLGVALDTRISVGWEECF